VLEAYQKRAKCCSAICTLKRATHSVLKKLLFSIFALNASDLKLHAINIKFTYKTGFASQQALVLRHELDAFIDEELWIN
jgi:hypothetical protein